MFKTAEKDALNQISLTGIRSIVLLGLLIVKPRSLEEIRQAFIDLNIMEEDNSDDILRIDINTIKHMGCEISRASQKTGYKYVLGQHPYSLRLTKKEINALKRAYNYIKATADLEQLVEYDILFRKISSHIYETETKEALLGISLLKYYDIRMIQDLLIDCAQSRTLYIRYKKPVSKNAEDKEIAVQKLIIQNDKVYLLGYDVQKQESVTLNVRRISEISARKLKQEGVEPRVVKVKYELDKFDLNKFQEGESVLEYKGEGCIVEGNYFNDFTAVQRILSLGAQCTVLEPIEIRNTVITKLKEMRDVYVC